MEKKASESGPSMDEARHKLLTTQIKKIETEIAERNRVLNESCIPVLLEITPPCDFDQDKRQLVRLVGGVLLTTETLIDRETEHWKKLEAICLDGFKGFSGDFTLVLSAHFVYGIPTGLFHGQPIGRLRGAVLADIQAWVAAQGARPGYVSVR